MRFKKTVISWLLIILSFLMFAISSYAQEAGTVVVQAPRYASSSAELSSDVDVDALTDYLREQLLACNESINVLSFGIGYEDTDDLNNIVIEIMNIIFYDIPEAFHVNSEIGFSYTIFQTLYSIEVHYDYDSSEFSSMYEDFTAQTDKMLDGICDNDSLTDVQKALLIHDRLALHCEYYNGNFAQMPNECYNAYGAMCAGVAVCSGYSKAYSYLLSKVGIESRICNSDELDHAWNIITIDGNEYHVDVTWDDITFGVSGQVKHTNFLRSSSGIYSTGHTADDYDSSPCDTTYDNYYWQTSNAAFQLLGDEIYYIDSSSRTICKMSDGSELLSFDAQWYSADGGVWPSCYSCLATDGESLFYSTDDTVYLYDPVYGTNEELWQPDLSGGSAYGIYSLVYSDGYLLCAVIDDPNYLYNNSTEDITQQMLYNAVVTGISISRIPTKTQYCIGDTLETDGLEITVSYSDGSTKTITEGFIVEEVSLSEIGSKSVTVEYKKYTAVFTVTVSCSHEDTSYYERIEPTCLTQGRTEYTQCNICSQIISGEDTVLDLTDHDYIENPTEDNLVSVADCVQAAVYCKSCSVCGEKSDETFSFGEIDPDNHLSVTVINQKDATCSENGYEGDLYCENCCTVTGSLNEIPMNQHDYVKTSETAPKCTESGFSTYTCTLCGDSYDSDYTVETGHNFSDWTELEDGSGKMVRVCVDCGEKEYFVEEIPADDEDGDDTENEVPDDTDNTSGGSNSDDKVTNDNDSEDITADDNVTDDNNSDNTIADDNVSDDKDSDDTTADDNVSDDKDSDDTTADDNASDDKDSDDTTADDDTSDDKDSDDTTAADDAADDKDSDDTTADDDAADDKDSDDTIADDNAADDKDSDDTIADDNAADDKDSDDTIADDNAADDKDSDDTTADDNAADDKDSDDTTADDDAADDKDSDDTTADGDAADDKYSDDTTADGDITDDKDSDDTTADDNVSDDKDTDDTTADDVSDDKNPDNTAVDNDTSDDTTTDSDISSDTNNDNVTSDTDSSDKVTTDDEPYDNIDSDRSDGDISDDNNSVDDTSDKTDSSTPVDDTQQDDTSFANDTVVIVVDNDTETKYAVVADNDNIAELVDFDNMRVVDANGDEIVESSKVGTGCIVIISDTLRYEIVLMCDVNGDGRSTAADARLALRVSANLEYFEGAYAIAADVVGDDNKITAADARVILRVSAGLDTVKINSDNPSNEQNTQTADEEVTSDAQPDENVDIANDASEIVYITPSGTKYHTISCYMISEPYISISRSVADDLGYEACKICEP